MSVAYVLTATVTVLVLVGHRAGRTHAASKDVRCVKKPAVAHRRTAWGKPRSLGLGHLVVPALLMLVLFAFAYTAGHQ